MNLFRVISITITMGLVAVSAQAGNEGGGGDPCENRIKIVSQDIESWIINGGAEELVLPENISVNYYSSSMLAQINKAQVICIDEKDPGYPVQVNSVPKVCRFDRQTNSSKITCDIRKFQALSETEQYMLIHHEYAGLAGIEKPNGADSDYFVSNQISEYLVDITVKKLAIKPNKYLNNYQASEYCKIRGGRLPTAKELAIEATKYGAEILELSQVSSKKPPKGFYKVSVINLDGSKDQFYYSRAKYSPQTDWWWTWSSSVSDDNPYLALHIMYTYGYFSLEHRENGLRVGPSIRCINN